MKFRTIIRIIADNDFEGPDGTTVNRPVAILPSWNWRKPVMLTSWPPDWKSFEEKYPARRYARVHRDDLNAEDDKWIFDVEWCD